MRIKDRILAAVGRGQIIVDDLQEELQMPRVNVVENARHMIAQGLIERVKEDITGLPAYVITDKGREELAKLNAGGAQSDPEPDQPEERELQEQHPQGDDAFDKWNELKKQLAESQHEASMLRSQLEQCQAELELARAMAVAPSAGEKPLGYMVFRNMPKTDLIQHEQQAMAFAEEIAQAGDPVRVCAVLAEAELKIEWRKAA